MFTKDGLDSQVESLEPTQSSLKVLGEKEAEYRLCSSAEPRLLSSMKHGLTILVNRHLLLKFNGRMSALCLKSFTTRDGTYFQKGVWYSPYGHESRQYFKSEYARGATALNLPSEALDDWAYIRKLTDARIWNQEKQDDDIIKKDTIFQMAINYANRISGERLDGEAAQRRVNNTYVELY